jgi:hypothetical protein
MLSLSYVVNRLKARMGAKVRRLEITDEQLVDLIMKETIPTFSIYFPYQHTIKINLKKDRVNNFNNRFFLRSDIPFNSVTRIYPDSGNLVGNSGMSGFGCNSGMEGLMMQASANMQSFYSVPTTFRFIPPFQLEIDPVNIGGIINCDLNAEHPDVATIHAGLREEFLLLAEYDMKIDLLGQRRFFASIGTVFGEVNLNLETLESAEDKRTELLQKFDDKHYLNSTSKKIWYE